MNPHNPFVDETQLFVKVTTPPEVEHPAPIVWLSSEEEHEELHDTLGILVDWVNVLRTLARGYSQQQRFEMLDLFVQVMRRPYLFEQNRSRWPDGLFHLVDRGYEPFEGAEFTLAELRDMGVVAWQQHCLVAISPDCKAVMDCEFEPSPCALLHVANIVALVARRVNARAHAELWQLLARRRAAQASGEHR